MSTTTEILFNSPALHSLKRDQLVKLCKIHAIKASGKNTELIEKLKHHAQMMPKDSPLSIAARSEDTTRPRDEAPQYQMPRPSEQWEVMDSIKEVDENSLQGTRNEFGTRSTVSSSLRALATSLGLKRTLANDPLVQNSTPYSALPPSTCPPQSDHFTFDPSRMSWGGAEAPLPGHALRPGVPAPSNARLSMGLGLGAPSTPSRSPQPTTTIRLISNPLSDTSINTLSYGAGENGTPQLKPFETTFDLVLGSPTPGLQILSSWPPREGGESITKNIYPTLTEHDYSPMPATPSKLNPPTEPFIFGSPLPQHNVTNTQFRVAATSVLEEMNKRLKEDGIEGVQIDLINKLHPGAHSMSDLGSREIKPIPGSKRGEIKEKFERMHEQEFKKMEGIDGLMKRRAERSPVRKSDGEKVVVGKKRKSSVLAEGRRMPGPIAGRASSTRVISNGRRAKQLPGAFGDDEDEMDEMEERGGKRVRMDAEVAATPIEMQQKKEEEEEEARQKEREKEAIKRRLEINRAKRRSSVAPGGLQGRRSGRMSIGKAKPQPKSSRFGFLSSAKSIVQSVWNRGKATTTTQSNIPKPAPVQPPPKVEEHKPKTTAAPLEPAKKASVGLARPTSIPTSTSSRISSIRLTAKDQESSIKGNSIVPSTRTSRNSSIAGPSRGTSIKTTRSSSTTVGGVSSIGTRLSTRVSSSNGAIGSMGSKKLLGGPSTSVSGSIGRASGTGSSSRLSSMSSRLLAPTASSLAKAAHRNSSMMASSGVKSVPNYSTPEPKSESKLGGTALGMITNTTSNSGGSPSKIPVPTSTPFSPRLGGIFGRPLDLTEGFGNCKGGNSATAVPSSGVMRQKSLAGRKPRISRSKVIAKLASQRTASGSGAPSGSGAGLGVGGHRASAGGRTRSSLGGGKRRSGAGAGGDVMMSAKKRARQSEYARRRSRVGAKD